MLLPISLHSLQNRLLFSSSEQGTLQVTLHNLALAASEEDTAGCFSKLHHLLTTSCFPAEAFSNLLLLYCSPQHALYDAAADLMAQNPDLVEGSISKVTFASPTCCRVLSLQRHAELLSCRRIGSPVAMQGKHETDYFGRAWGSLDLRGCIGPEAVKAFSLGSPDRRNVSVSGKTNRKESDLCQGHSWHQ